MSIKSYTDLILQNIFSKVTLRELLIIPFVLQIFGAVGLTGWLSLRNGQKAVNNVAAELRHEITARIEGQFNQYLNIPYTFNRLNAAAFTTGNFDMINANNAKQFLTQVEIAPFIDSSYCGDAQGNFLGAELSTDIKSSRIDMIVSNQKTNYNSYRYAMDKWGNKQQLLEKEKPYDPRKRPWYISAVKAGKPSIEVYPNVLTGRPTMSASEPVYNEKGEFIGVCAVGVSLFGTLRTFLTTLSIGKTGQAFVIDRGGLLISSSTKVPPNLPQGEQDKLMSAALESKDQLVRETAQYLQEKFGGFQQIKRAEQLDFNLKNQRQFVQVLPLNNDQGIDWIIVVVVPESDFMEQINTNTRTTIILCLLALIIATAIGIFTSDWIVKPIGNLSQAASLIAQGNLDQKVDIKGVEEIKILARSFNRMAQQLQESFAILESKNQDLQHLDKMKDEFLANTSHELRTPLNGIIGIAESLIDGATGNLPEATQTNLGLIVSSGRRLSSLVNDILDFSKLKSKNLELQLKPVDLRAITDLILTLSQPLAQGKDLELINNIPQDFPAAEADENRLQQILYNLVGNAIKFTPSGTVKIFAESWENKLNITVADTGIGISEDKFERIFESFEQAEGSTARDYGGTGLGLAVTKQLVELHDGEITVKSQRGVGSQFTFTLPISQEKIDKIVPINVITEVVISPLKNDLFMPNQPIEVIPNSANIKVLIVDDEPVNLQVLINNLSRQNYAITQATNGEEALKIIEAGLKPDIILLDVMMPKMTGYQVTQKLRESYLSTELPIILLTAKNQTQDIVTGLDLGANDYLSKPIAKDELLARMRTQINMTQLRLENMRMSAELDVTRKLQEMILPTQEEVEAIAELEISGFMEPADEVGGDYYDILQYNGGVKIGIGDVTGHGLESGILMLMAQTAVRTLLESNQSDPVQFLDILNRTLYGNIRRMESPKNMTLALLDYSDGMMKISGQHEEIIIIRANGEVEQIDTMNLGFPIALVDEIVDFITSEEVELNLGDVVILYTDGITEAKNMEKKQYGLNRLIEVAQKNYQHSTDEIRDAIINNVRQFIGEQKVFDDITLVVLKRKEGV